MYLLYHIATARLDQSELTDHSTVNQNNELQEPESGPSWLKLLRAGAGALTIAGIVGLAVVAGHNIPHIFHWVHTLLSSGVGITVVIKLTPTTLLGILYPCWLPLPDVSVTHSPTQAHHIFIRVAFVISELYDWENLHTHNIIMSRSVPLFSYMCTVTLTLH